MEKILQEIESIFCVGGKLSKVHPQYEYRPQQLEMALSVYKHLASGIPLLIEAPPGVGKTLGYLVPLAYWVTNNKDTRSIVATGTKTLQQQLLTNDSEILSQVLPFNVKVSCLFGNQNYGCKRRCKRLLDHGEQLLGKAYLEEIQKLYEWFEINGSTLLNEVPWKPSTTIWDYVQRDPEICSYQRCSDIKCYFYNQKEESKHSQILIVNHALLMSDLIIEPGSILGQSSGCIIDEAHLFDDSAARSLGISVSANRILSLLNDIVQEKNNKGILKRLRAKNDQFELFASSVESLKKQTLSTFKKLSESYQINNGKDFRNSKEWKEIIKELGSLSISISDLSTLLSRNFSPHIKDEDDSKEFNGITNRLKDIARKIKIWINPADPAIVSWIEPESNGTLSATKVTPGDFLKERLHRKDVRVVYTSATLSVNNNFDFMKKQLGLNQWDGKIGELILDSPFDYKRQSYLYYDIEAPDPTEDDEGYRKYVNSAMLRVVKTLDGRTLCLLTSWSHLREAAKYFREEGIEPYVQGELDPNQIIERYINDPSKPILAVQTFWTGIDLPVGKVLAVCIARLPFDSPGDPRTKAVCDHIEKSGGNYFLEWLVPSAVLLLKNGFGRQIRSKKHYGAIYIIDPRVSKKSYGKIFKKSLPNSTELNTFQELIAVLQKLSKNKSN